MSRISKALLFLGSILILCPLMRADTVDDVVAAQMKKRHIPGLSLAVIDGGAIVRAQGYGFESTAGLSPVTADTLFLAGSVSKSVSALGALRLVEEGKLALDTDVNATLRSWHVPENDFTKEKKVTLRLILSHSAGLTVHGFGGYAVGDPVPTLVQVLDGAEPANSDPIRVDSIPGTKWRYSGGGYTVMQQMIIDVTGEPFPKFMEETVLGPLGMRASTFDQPLPETLTAKAATGYTGTDEAVPGKWHIYPEMAAAGLWTTPSDLARFVMAVQQSYQGRSNPVISEATTREMLTEQREGDGLGVFFTGKGAARRFGHNGRDEGFDAFMAGYVERGQGAVVMVNCNENSHAVVKIVDAIADAYRWPDFEHWAPARPIEDKEPVVTDRLKALFEQIQTGTFDRVAFTPELAKLIDAAHAKQVAKHDPGLGSIKSFALVWHNSGQKERKYAYVATCDNDTVIATFTFQADGRISEMWVGPE
jgi:CubicO group peptidase (beta-lactamase class C family)